MKKKTTVLVMMFSVLVLSGLLHAMVIDVPTDGYVYGHMSDSPNDREYGAEPFVSDAIAGDDVYAFDSVKFNRNNSTSNLRLNKNNIGYVMYAFKAAPGSTISNVEISTTKRVAFGAIFGIYYTTDATLAQNTIDNWSDDLTDFASWQVAGDDLIDGETIYVAYAGKGGTAAHYDWNLKNDTITFTVPEPATMCLLGFGGLPILSRKLRRS